MGDLSENFSRYEFKCKCTKYCKGEFDVVDAELIRVLEETREYFLMHGGGITINSGDRCMQHNIDEGGSTSSVHCEGKASDFVVRGVSADLVADYLENRYPDKYGIGRYDGRTHIDVRELKARWDRRS